MTNFPAGFISHLGGVVSSKSVKLLDKILNPGNRNMRHFNILIAVQFLLKNKTGDKGNINDDIVYLCKI